MKIFIIYESFLFLYKNFNTSILKFFDSRLNEKCTREQDNKWG